LDTFERLIKFSPRELSGRGCHSQGCGIMAGLVCSQALAAQAGDDADQGK